MFSTLVHYFSSNLAAFYNLRTNSTNPDISRSFCQPAEYSKKIWLRGLFRRQRH